MSWQLTKSDQFSSQMQFLGAKFLKSRGPLMVTYTRTEQVKTAETQNLPTNWNKKPTKDHMAQEKGSSNVF